MSARGDTRIIIERVVRQVVHVNAMAWDEDDVRQCAREKWPDARVVWTDIAADNDLSDDEVLERHR